MNRLAAQFWPFGQYRDVSRGTLFERSAARRHNRELARGLPAYINRWLMLSAVLLISTHFAPDAVAPFLGVLFTLAFCCALQLAYLWVLLRRLK